MFYFSRVRQIPYLAHLCYVLRFMVQLFYHSVESGCDLLTVNRCHCLRVHSSKYLCNSFVRLDLADLVELLDASPWFDEPLYDLYFFDTYDRSVRIVLRITTNSHLLRYQRVRMAALSAVVMKHERDG